MSLQAKHAQICSDSNRTRAGPKKPLFGLQQALQKQQILQKALLRMSGGGVSAKCNYVKFKAFPHNLSTVPGCKTALFCVTRNPVQFFLKTTDHMPNHSSRTNWTCRHGIKYQSPQLEYTPQLGRTCGLCAQESTMPFWLRGPLSQNRVCSYDCVHNIAASFAAPIGSAYATTTAPIVSCQNNRICLLLQGT